MKTEDQAWRALQQHATRQLHSGFADRVLRAAHGPQAATWQQLQAHAAAHIRPGFAERVLRAARSLPGVPSLRDQLALSAATAALCLVAVVFVHSLNVRIETRRNLADWQELVAETPDLDQTQ
jgi:hypothetical protein